MSDIVELGRNLAAIHDRYRMPDAAEGFTILTDEITRLRAENERLREALADCSDALDDLTRQHHSTVGGILDLTYVDNARAALEPEGR